MRVSVLEAEIETLESQSQLSRPRLRLSEVSLSFETKTGKFLMVETETRIWTIFENETIWAQPLNAEAETDSLADFWSLIKYLVGEFE